MVALVMALASTVVVPIVMCANKPINCWPAGTVHSTVVDVL